MTHVFDALPTLPADPILSLMLAFRADTSPAKVDLTVGVYKDSRGRTPIMRAVALAESPSLPEATPVSRTTIRSSGSFSAFQAITVL